MSTVDYHPATKTTIPQIEKVKAELKETREEAKAKKAIELEHIAIEFDHENSENLLIGGQVIVEEKEDGGGNVKEDLMREIEVYQEKLADKEQLVEQLQKVRIDWLQILELKENQSLCLKWSRPGNECEFPTCWTDSRDEQDGSAGGHLIIWIWN